MQYRPRRRAFGIGYDSCARLCTTAAPTDRVVVGIERLLEALEAMRNRNA